VRHFWLFTVMVRTLDGPSRRFRLGSEPWLQVVVPGFNFEESLQTLGAHLANESYERLDLMLARRYHLDNASEEYPSAYIRQDGEMAVESGRPVTSVAIIGDDDAVDD
jgi:hypothetical protein